MSFRWTTGKFNFNFIQHLNPMLWVSGALVALSLFAVLAFGLNFGTDFAGGYELQVKFPRDISETQVREVLEPLKLGELRVQRLGSVEEHESLILVREGGVLSDAKKDALKVSFEQLAGGSEKLATWSISESGDSLNVSFVDAISEDQIRELIGNAGLEVKQITRSSREDRSDYVVNLVGLADRIERALRQGLQINDEAALVSRVEFVGPQVGSQLRNQGIMAVLYALGFILIYVAIRFDLYFAPGAIIALIHDIIVTMGVFAVFQLEFNLTGVAAILTLIGYSLNDTIIVYDRVRENVAKMRSAPLRNVVNVSLNETLSRTVLTSGCTALVSVSLMFLGGEFIRNFAIAMTVGIITGTYSSISIATPIYVLLRERYDRSQKSATRVVAA